MIKNKRVKKIIYDFKGKYWTVNDKFEIDDISGCVWWSWAYVGARKDFPQYIFNVAKQLINNKGVKNEN